MEELVVYEAENGKEGLDMSLELHPRLILLDLIMPEMNGMDMLKQLRQDEWGKTASVVLLTNLGDRESIENAKKFGVEEYLVKSDWSLDEIALKVKELLR
jgi:NarL family two-component system response regulator LiaR